mgnify:FL=1
MAAHVPDGHHDVKGILRIHDLPFRPVITAEHLQTALKYPHLDCQRKKEQQDQK